MSPQCNEVHSPKTSFHQVAEIGVDMIDAFINLSLPFSSMLRIFHQLFNPLVLHGTWSFTCLFRLIRVNFSQVNDAPWSLGFFSYKITHTCINYL